ncbi:MAG: hypothetical protein ACOCVQ_00485 [Bacillota bacterium]
MKIDLSHDEYMHLVEMLHMARWMLDSYIPGEPPEELRPYAELEQKIMAHARKFGVGEDLIEWVPGMGRYFHTRQFEEESGVFDRIEKYDGATVWEELPFWLARRDFVEEYGEQIDYSNEDELAFAYYDLVRKYHDEFLENGVENLRLCTGREKGGR